MQVRTWCGDFVDLPLWQGPADAVFFNAVFGNMHDQRAALLAAAALLRPGGSLVISHPLGRSATYHFTTQTWWTCQCVVWCRAANVASCQEEENVSFHGREWLAGLHRASPEQVPHELPDEAALADLTADLPLRLVAFTDEPELYLAHLQARVLAYVLPLSVV